MCVAERRRVLLNFALTFLLAFGLVGGPGVLLAATADRPALVQNEDQTASRVAQLATPGQPAPATSDAAAPGSPPAGPHDMPQVDGEATLPRDLSPWGMFMAADHVVKAVMIGLALASVLSWTVWLAKSLELLGAKRRANNGLRTLAQVALPA